jgi:thymidine phosphorylase
VKSSIILFAGLYGIIVTPLPLLPLNGVKARLSDADVLALAQALLDRGRVFDWSGLGKPCVDVYSSGCVGDKLPLILAPLISSLNVAVPMISGRGVGHWGHIGGTLDKLESIPGVNTRLWLTDARAQLEQIGCFIMELPAEPGTDDELVSAMNDAPDVAARVPLLAARAMSAKLQESLDALVLYASYGSAALLPLRENAEELARLSELIGSHYGCVVSTLHCQMESPLGRAIGNSLEVEEAFLALQGDDGAPRDLVETALLLGTEMLRLAGVLDQRADAREMLQAAIDDGRALRQMERIVEAQGGNPAVVEDTSLLPQSNECEVFRAPRKGTVLNVAGGILAEGHRELGASGDHSVGFVVTVKPGDWVEAGDAIASVMARDGAGTRRGLETLSHAIRIGRREAGNPGII